MLFRSERAALEWDQALERLTAEATMAAYSIALRHGAEGSWLDLQLGLWRAMARTVREWGRLPSGPPAEGSIPGDRGSDRPRGRPGCGCAC